MLEPADTSNVPAAHDEHELAPLFEYLPEVHGPVTNDRPAVAQKDPAEQESQAEEPVDDSNFPAGQLEQALAPAAEYVPMAHAPVQVDADKPVELP